MGFLSRPQSAFFRRSLFQVHLWVGLLIGLYVFVVCTTGAALVFRIHMQRASSPELFRPGQGQPAHPAAIIDAIVAAYPDHRLSFIDAPTVDRATWLTYPFKDDVYKAVLVDPVTARVLGEVPEDTWIRTLQALHFDLLGGRTGRAVNGIGGALLLVMCVTGLVIWWPGSSSWRRGLVVDFSRGWKRVNWELHSAVGIWSGALIAAWAITGIYLVWPSEFRDAVNAISPVTTVEAPRSNRSARVESPPTWQALIDRARQEVPGQHVAQVVMPFDDTAAFEVKFSREQPTRAGLPALTTVYLDQYSGDVLPVPAESPRTPGDVIMRWAAPLHVGNFGGLPIRLAWLVFGLAPPLLFVTGFTMWWTRVIRPRWLNGRTRPALSSSHE